MAYQDWERVVRRGCGAGLKDDRLGQIIVWNKGNAHEGTVWSSLVQSSQAGFTPSIEGWKYLGSSLILCQLHKLLCHHHFSHYLHHTVHSHLPHHICSTHQPLITTTLCILRFKWRVHGTGNKPGVGMLESVFFGWKTEPFMVYLCNGVVVGGWMKQPLKITKLYCPEKGHTKGSNKASAVSMRKEWLQLWEQAGESVIWPVYIKEMGLHT